MVRYPAVSCECAINSNHQMPSCNISVYDVERVRLTKGLGRKAAKARMGALAISGSRGPNCTAQLRGVCLPRDSHDLRRARRQFTGATRPSIWLLGSRMVCYESVHWILHKTGQHWQHNEIQARAQSPERLCIWIWFRLKMLEHAHPAAQCRNCFSTFRALEVGQISSVATLFDHCFVFQVVRGWSIVESVRGTEPLKSQVEFQLADHVWSSNKFPFNSPAVGRVSLPGQL